MTKSKPISKREFSQYKKEDEKQDKKLIKTAVRKLKTSKASKSY